MDFIFSITSALSDTFRDYTQEITIGLVATLLVIYGDTMIKFIKNQIKPLHFLPRLLILVTVSAVGFTALTKLSTSLLGDLLKSLPDRWFSVVVILCFFSVGIIAERKRYM